MEIATRDVELHSDLQQTCIAVELRGKSELSASSTRLYHRFHFQV